MRYFAIKGEYEHSVIRGRHKISICKIKPWYVLAEGMMSISLVECFETEEEAMRFIVSLNKPKKKGRQR